MDKENPFINLKSTLEIGGKTYNYYDINKLNDERIKKLPVSIKVLL